jgi:hypothetical protein
MGVTAMKEFNMRVESSGYDVGKTRAIMNTFGDEWKLNDSHECKGQLHLTADCILVSARESEKDIATRLSIAVWRANGKYCEVSVDIEDTDDDLYTTYSLDETDYEREIEGITSDMFVDIWGLQERNEGCVSHDPSGLKE